MSDFSRFLELLKDGLVALAKERLESLWKSAVQDGEAFLEKSKEDLKRWTARLAAGELSQEDFADLVKGQLDLAEMELLKQAGLTLAQIEHFRISLLNLVVDTAFKVFL